MSRNKPSLIDILNVCESIGRFIQNKTKDDFFDDEMVQEAVIRKIETIGEASNRVTDEWVRAVNDFGGFGKWIWGVVRAPNEIIGFLK